MIDIIVSSLFIVVIQLHCFIDDIQRIFQGLMSVSDEIFGNSCTDISKNE